MKRFFLFALAAIVFAACSTDTTQDLAPEIPDTLTVSFDEETRVQLDAECKTVWNADDLVSVFYRSDANDCWRFMGETGDRTGLLVSKTSNKPTISTNEVVAVYPYNAGYCIDASDKTLSVRIPATQRYENGSYGIGANIMVSTGTGRDISLKSVCGWIKLQLTGSGKVTQVTLRGNDDEQIAGLATVNYADYSLSLIADGLGNAAADGEVGGTLVNDRDYVREITLDCGEGVALNADTPTAFYFVLAPQTFEKGITITAMCDDGTRMTKSTSNSITVERNHIVPMNNIDYVATNLIYYTSSDGNVIEPYKTNVFGANIVSNTYENGGGIITFDGDVTAIGDFAFDNCEALTSVTIPDSVTTIGDAAFSYCDALTSVTIPDSVTEIGNSAFTHCSALTSITIPDSVTTIESGAFSSCSALTSVTIPDSVTTIGYGSFNNCSSLLAFYGKFASKDNHCLIVDNALISVAHANLSTDIPEGVTTIECFACCRPLRSITIPSTVTAIKDNAFVNSSLQCVNITDLEAWCKIDFDCQPLFYAKNLYLNGELVEDLVVPANVSELKHHTFRGATCLKSVTILDGVNSIENEVFRDCTSLQRFYGKFASEDNRCLIMNGTLKAFAPVGLTEYTIPNSVTSISDYAFTNCPSSIKISFPSSIKAVGSNIFGSKQKYVQINILDLEAWCNIDFQTSPPTSFLDTLYLNGDLIENLVIPSSITNIKPYAFFRLKCLKTLQLQEGLIFIGQRAFFYNELLTTVTIPSSVKHIGHKAFNFCKNLKEVYCKSVIPPTVTLERNEWDAFGSNATDRKIYVPSNSVDAYKAADGWSEYADAIEPYTFTE